MEFLRSVSQGSEKHGEIAFVHDGLLKKDLRHQQNVKTLQVVPGHARVHMVTNVVVDVVPEPGIQPVAEDGARARELPGIPWRSIVFRHKPDAVEKRKTNDGPEPQHQRVKGNAESADPFKKGDGNRHVQCHFSQMDRRLFPSQGLRRKNEDELESGEQDARQGIGVKHDEIAHPALPHHEGVGVLGGAVVAMVDQVVFTEGDERDQQRDHGKNAKGPVLPSRLEEHVVNAVVHEGDHAHLHVAHANIAGPDDEPVLRVPGHGPQPDPYSVVQRYFEVGLPAVLVQVF